MERPRDLERQRSYPWLNEPLLTGEVLGRRVITLRDAVKLTDPTAPGWMSVKGRLGKALTAIVKNVPVHSCPHSSIVFLEEFEANLPKILECLFSPIYHAPYFALEGLVPRFEVVPYTHAAPYLGVSWEELIYLLERGVVALGRREPRLWDDSLRRYRRLQGPVLRYQPLVMVPLALLKEIRHGNLRGLARAEAGARAGDDRVPNDPVV